MYTFKTSALKEYLVRMFYLSSCICINVLFRIDNGHFRGKTVEDMGDKPIFRLVRGSRGCPTNLSKVT